MKPRHLMIGLAAALLLSSLTTAPALAAGADHAFVGADKCKLCHNSLAKGAQYNRWKEEKHSKAYLTLAGEEAKKLAAAKGIADPQKAAECLKCHVTGHGAPADKLTDKYKVEDGVGCESCHGPGGDYWTKEVMQDKQKSIAAGMKIPDEQTCKGCHNPESPSYKEFDFKTYHAKIAHPNPQNAAK